MTNFDEEQKKFISTLLDELTGEEKCAADFFNNPSGSDDIYADGYNKREQELRNKIEEIKENL